MTLSVFHAAAEAPDRTALLVGDEAITFASLGERVRRRIAWLAERGIPTNDDRPVALVGSSDLNSLEVVFALLELGQPMALVHPRLTESERRAVAELVAPALYLDVVPALDVTDRRDKSAPTTPSRSAAVDPERCCAILFTSGTTGAPKGIVLSRRAFVAAAAASERNLGWRDDDRWLLGLPIAHVGGLSILTRCLLARRTVVIPAEVAAGKRLDPDALVRSIDVARVTLVSVVPTQLEWLLSGRSDWTAPPELRAVLLGGAAARPALLERAAARGLPVLTTYGLTEACSQVTTQPVGTVNRGELGSGKPMDGTEVRLVDGAVQVRGPTLLSGYVPTGARSPLDADGWLHTDDLGRFDDAGYLHLLGRRSDLIITGGENVHPAEVEAVLERCPGVAAACVFGVPDETWGELVAVAIVAGAAGAAGALSDAAFGEFVRTHLGKHRQPRLVAMVDAFATTAAGKLDRAGTARHATPMLRRLA